MDHTQFKKLTSQELDKSRKVPLSFSLRTSLIDLMLRLKYHNVMRCAIRYHLYNLKT